MKLTPGRIVFYKLSENDCVRIRDMRQLTGKVEVATMTAGAKPDYQNWKVNHGNEPMTGDVVPAIVVRPWTDHNFNGQAILDGNDTLWITSVEEGENPGQWQWPIKEE